MRIGKWIASGLLVLVVAVLLLSALSPYIKLEPPASVITVPFRMF